MQESRVDLADIMGGPDLELPVTLLQASSYLRHTISETIAGGVINCLLVTDSTEANIELTRIYEHRLGRG